MGIVTYAIIVLGALLFVWVAARLAARGWYQEQTAHLRRLMRLGDDETKGE